MALHTMDVKVQALLDVLDEDIRDIEATLLRLDALRTMLVKRDDAGLERLLEDIRRQSESHAVNERKRQDLRAELAVAAGCGPGDLTLSKLRAHLPEPSRTAVAQRQNRLRSLVAQLKREHLLTTVLLSDCTRFNRSLMQTFFGLSGTGNVTYSPSGAARHRSDTTLVSLKY